MLKKLFCIPRRRNKRLIPDQKVYDNQDGKLDNTVYNIALDLPFGTRNSTSHDCPHRATIPSAERVQPTQSWQFFWSVIFCARPGRLPRPCPTPLGPRSLSCSVCETGVSWPRHLSADFFGVLEMLLSPRFSGSCTGRFSFSPPTFSAKINKNKHLFFSFNFVLFCFGTMTLFWHWKENIFIVFENWQTD